VGIAALIIFIGSIVIGTIIGEFSNILSEMTKKARQQNEELHLIGSVMTTLKIPEETQNRVYEYFDIKNEGKYVRNEKFYEILNYSLQQTIRLFQTEEAIMRTDLFDHRNSSQIENFANLIKIATFMPQDVLVKQGDIGDKFFLILDGMVEIVSEFRDFEFFDFEQTVEFIGISEEEKAR